MFAFIKRRPPAPNRQLAPEEVDQYGNTCLKQKGKSTFLYDNSRVIAHNKAFTLRFQCHINFEWCDGTGAVSYVLKYVMKGKQQQQRPPLLYGFFRV